jgi:hypothetical protein
MRVLVAWLVLVLAQVSARAEVIGLAVSGGDGASLHDDVEKQLSRWLKKHGFTVYATPLSDDAITTVANCLVIDDPKCASAVIDARATTGSVVFVKLDVAGPQRDITFTTYWFVKTHPASGERRSCEKCSGDAWRPLADTAMQALRTSVGDTVKPDPIRVDKPIVAPPPTRPGSHVLPGVLILGGVASLATGAVYFWYGSKGGTGDKFVYPDSSGWGIAFSAIGAGLTIGGAVLWRQASAGTPIAAIDAHGGYVGWITRF